GSVCAVHADGGALYLAVGRNVLGLRTDLRMGQVVAHPMSIHKVDAATGRASWKDLNQELSTASFPLTQAGATVAVTVGGTTFGTGMLVALLGTSDGRRIQTVELVGRPHPLYSASALGARYLSVGPAHVVADRLCTEGLAGITVYRVKDAPTPQKP
ncbi:MAG: hypothetical protein NTV86_09490, partial [Planctomycetota bacterium]|nr:hypothetical protein [Planctomycetota bacterium]